MVPLNLQYAVKTPDFAGAVQQGMAFRNAQDALEAGKQAKIASAAQAAQAQQRELGARLAQSVLSAPVGERAAVYASALEQAGASGIDLSGLPTSYDPSVADPMLKNVAALGLKAEDQASRLFKGQESATQREFLGSEGRSNRAIQWAQLNQQKELAQAKIDAAAKEAALKRGSKIIATEFELPEGVTLSPTEIGQVRSQTRTLSNVESAAESYKKLLQKTGPTTTIFGMAGKDTKLLQQAYKDITIEAKNLFELGALSGPDMELITGYLPEPTSREAIAMGAEGMVKGIDNVFAKLKSAKRNIAKSYDLKYLPDEAQKPKNQAEFDKTMSQAQNALSKGISEEAINKRLAEKGMPPLQKGGERADSPRTNFGSAQDLWDSI